MSTKSSWPRFDWFRRVRDHNGLGSVELFLLNVGYLFAHHFCAWPFQSDPHWCLSFSLTSGGKSYVNQEGVWKFNQVSKPTTECSTRNSSHYLSNLNRNMQSREWMQRLKTGSILAPTKAWLIDLQWQLMWETNTNCIDLEPCPSILTRLSHGITIYKANH
jgi:hypothetical protein